jgi:hypothetical protein
LDGDGNITYEFIGFATYELNTMHVYEIDVNKEANRIRLD